MDLRGKRIEEGYTNLVTVEGDSVASSGKLQNGQGTDLGNIAVGGLSFNSGDGELQLPAGTTAERPASPSAGYARFNTDKGKVEIYTGAAWLSIALEGAVQLEAATATVTGQDAVATLSGFISQFGTPAAAYSVRKLGSVTNAIRVRRSSDNAEQDIGFDGGDLDESALTTFVGANDGFVTTWYDQSGNGNNATQATAGSQPKIVSSGTVIKENSVPALDFDGSDDELIAGDIFDGLTSFYTSSVFKFTDNGDFKGIHTEAPGGVGNRSFSLAVDDSSPPKIGLVVETPSFSSVQESTSSSGQNVLITTTYNGSAIELFKDGSSQGTDANSGSTTTNAGKFTIGARRAGVNNADVQFNEIIIYDSDKSSDRTDIESNINDYYGIY